MKAFTDIDQSKKLAEFLSIGSADGFYEAQHNPLTDKWEYILFTDNKWASAAIYLWKTTPYTGREAKGGLQVRQLNMR